ncbi:MAG: DUF1848 domain-containing protein [Desulfobacula sp.]|nr:DUF1848 domain-containing protein [Desulfobacula sp.]
MSQDPGFILSASRRTDIPGFYMDWFMARIERGIFDVKNPFTRIVKQIDVNPETVHAIVFWSKNFDVLIRSGAGQKLIAQGFNLYFNFTINSESSLLEPQLPNLSKRLKQLENLADEFGPKTICWRFDPICFYQSQKNGPQRSNLTHFPIIANKASSLGITKCVTSFFDDYAKITRRLKKVFKKDKTYLRFIDPPIQKKTDLIQRMSQNLTALGIDLHLCCENKIFKTLEPSLRIKQNACIDGKYYQQFFKGNGVTARDYGQRAKKGCQCTKSIDIGSYDDHPCYHNCLFCYANPHIDTVLATTFI